MAICWESAVLLAFHFCCFNFSAILVVRVLSHLVFGAGFGIRLYRFLIIAFFIYFVYLEHPPMNPMIKGPKALIHSQQCRINNTYILGTGAFSCSKYSQQLGNVRMQDTLYFWIHVLVRACNMYGDVFFPFSFILFFFDLISPCVG